MPLNQQQSGSLDQQIRDAIASGSVTRRLRDQQDVSDRIAARVSASAVARSASLDDDKTADAVCSALPQRIQQAIALGHGFVPLLEIKGEFNAHKLPQRAEKIIAKLTGLGLNVTILNTSGPVSGSRHLGIKLS